MHAIHPDLVAGMTIRVRDERENPLGQVRIIAATTATLTVACGAAQATLTPDALLAYDRHGLAVSASQLGPTLLDALRTQSGAH